MFFSVIIPVYKVENYLNQCVDSVLEQSYKDYEIILVDDGSPDLCPQICDDFAKNYDNIKVIHQINGGLSDARNTGIKAAKGKYICFIDSDDYWEDNDALKQIQIILSRSDADVLRIGMKLVSAKDGSVISDPKADYSDFEGLSSTQVIGKFVKSKTLKISACSMFLKRSFVIENDLFFKKGIKTEDLEWAMRVFEQEPTWSFYPYNLFVSRRGRPGSISSTVDYKHLLDYCEIIESSVDRIVRNKDTELREVLISYLMYQELILVAFTGRLKSFKEKKSLNQRNKKICRKYLCAYRLDKRVFFCSKVYRAFGYGAMQVLLSFYLGNRKR